MFGNAPHPFPQEIILLTSARVPAAAVVLAGLLLTSACANGGQAAPQSSSLPDADVPGASPSSPASAPSSSPTRGETGAGETGGGESGGGESGGGESGGGGNVGSSGGGESAAGGGGVFSGTRQVLLLPKNSEATLGVVGGGKVGLSSSFGADDLFVLTPVARGGDIYRIRTAKLRSGGEPLCLSAEVGAGGKPAAVLAIGCDASASSQQFSFRRSGESNGKPTYTIRTGRDTYIVQDPTGTISGTGTGIAAVTIGEGTADIDTPFVIADRGAASLPALD